jgi:3-deoxy-D-manno-octulosonic acid kinase
MKSTDPVTMSKLAQGNNLYLWNPTQLEQFDQHIFDPRTPALTAQNVTEGGRKAAWFIDINGLSCVLKFYQRGGVAAYLNRSNYFWLGQARARSFHEFTVMRKLQQLGLPIPDVVAAACWRHHGMLYRAALITKRIDGAIPLARSTDPEDWFNAGRVVRSMHQLEVWHADLNVFNILLDTDRKVWLIDFDRARINLISRAEKDQNIARLQRSVKKVLHFQADEFWLHFVWGYSGISRD